jgi:hypothetical protein
MHIDRKELIQEERLRLLIRKSIKTVNRKKMLEEQQQLEDQQKLRSYVIKLVEAEKNLVAPHPSTGINVLEDLLKKIIPQIEAEYKKLTTSHEQRASFQTHIINALQNSLAPTMASEKAGSAEEEEKAIDIDLYERLDGEQANISNMAFELERLAPGETVVIERSDGEPDKFFIKHNEDDSFSMSHDLYKKPIPSDHHQNMSIDEMTSWLSGVEKSSNFRKLYKGKLSEELKKKLFEADEIEMEVGDEVEADASDNNEFIDIAGGEKPDPAAEKADAFGVEGEDETGRNMAFKAFERVETSVVDAYAILSNDEDRELFYDYLLTNMKLYFDKFEDELTSILPEPTTPEYEAEKDQQDFTDEEGEEGLDDLGGEDELGGEEGLEDLEF